MAALPSSSSAIAAAPATTRDFLGLGPLLLPSPPPNPPPSGSHSPICSPSDAALLFLALGTSSHGRFIEGSGDSQWLAESQLPLLGNSSSFDAPSTSAASCPKQNGGQLTIFYAGNVNVFDNVPVDKAQAIMNWASSGKAWPEYFRGSTPRIFSTEEETLQQAGNAGHLFSERQACQNPYTAGDRIMQRSPLPPNWNLEFPSPDSSCSDSIPLLMVPGALPQARKASLARFLERRKERMRKLCPYIRNNSAQWQHGWSATQDPQFDENRMALTPFYMPEMGTARPLTDISTTSTPLIT